MAVEFNTGLVEGELPVDGSAGGVALGHTGRDVGRQFSLGRDALVQALAGDGGEFGFDQAEPAGVFRAAFRSVYVLAAPSQANLYTDLKTALIRQHTE